MLVLSGQMIDDGYMGECALQLHRLCANGHVRVRSNLLALRNVFSFVDFQPAGYLSFGS